MTDFLFNIRMLYITLQVFQLLFSGLEKNRAGFFHKSFLLFIYRLTRYASSHRKKAFLHSFRSYTGISVLISGREMQFIKGSPGEEVTPGRVARQSAHVTVMLTVQFELFSSGGSLSPM